MAEVRDNRNKTLDFLGGVTAFSGQDIEVFAFRDLTAIDRLQIEKFEQEKSEIIRQQSELGRYINEQRSIRDTLRGVEPAFKELLNSANDILNPTPDTSGKSQNRLDLTSELDEDIREGMETLEYNAVRIEEIDKTVKGLKNQVLVKLGDLHTISYSSFREVNAVRTLGRVQAKSYTKGPRTIAGTMVFTLMQEHNLMKLTQLVEDGQKPDPRVVMLDQIVPFNLMLVFANEFGSYSIMILFDVTIQSEGQSMSVEDLVTRSSLNYLCQEMIPVTPIGNAFNTYDQMLAAVLKEGGFKPGVKSNKNQYRVVQRLEQLANSKASKKLSDEIDTMLADSRNLF